MRRKLVAGNWKMNLSEAQAIALCKELRMQIGQKDWNCEVMVFPSYVYLQEARNILEGTVVGLGAQDCSAFASGAYTGDVSAAMIKSLNIQHVLIGHSERRQFHQENDAILFQKLQLALQADLQPVLCVGESLEIRDHGTHLDTVAGQLQHTLFALSPDQAARVILAYEPVWAIGTGRNATVDQAQEMHRHLRSAVSKHFGSAFADSLRILYGGSCKPSNAQELFQCADVDGGLIGGASLSVADFMAIIQAA